MTATDYTNLVRVLAEFAAWLEPRATECIDLAYYRQLAVHFLESGGTHGLVDVPQETVDWCDLCGCQFSKHPNHKLEGLTGNNFCWCPTCHQQQSHVYFLLGSEQYRAAWAAQEGDG